MKAMTSTNNKQQHSKPDDNEALNTSADKKDDSLPREKRSLIGTIVKRVRPPVERVLSVF